MAFEWYETEVQALEKTCAFNPPPPFSAVVFYGSSSIRLWKSLADDFKEIKTINLGFGGSTLASCEWFFERLVVPCQPRSIVFYAGDNDLGDGKTPQEVTTSLHGLLHKVSHHLGQIPFAFISIKPSLSRLHLLAKIQQANELAQQELSQRPFSYYIDVFEPMLDRDGRPRPELFAEDRLHLNPTGYQLWTEVVAAHHDRIF